MPTADDIELVRRALEGAPSSGRDLIDRIGPAIHAEIGQLLMRLAPAHGRSARQEVEDLVQDAFLALFDRASKRLAGWDPERGCTLDSYVRMVARSRALDVLRSRRRSPWKDEDPPDELETASNDGGALDHRVLARGTLLALERQLQDLLAPRDYTLFVALFVEELPPNDVAKALGLTPGAIYQWSSRFRRHTLPRLAASLGEAQPPDEPARPDLNPFVKVPHDPP